MSEAIGPSDLPRDDAWPDWADDACAPRRLSSLHSRRSTTTTARRPLPQRGQRGHRHQSFCFAHPPHPSFIIIIIVDLISILDKYHACL
ncbi:hypothetical protein BDZ89DRAFT_602714 [Hymenopellis radicata]|nr:hypothetical protein BDZ89DRAFT_602714 [Hymenopellis radicata]